MNMGNYGIYPKVFHDIYPCISLYFQRSAAVVLPGLSIGGDSAEIANVAKPKRSGPQACTGIAARPFMMKMTYIYLHFT